MSRYMQPVPETVAMALTRSRTRLGSLLLGSVSRSVDDHSPMAAVVV